MNYFKFICKLNFLFIFCCFANINCDAQAPKPPLVVRCNPNVINKNGAEETEVLAVWTDFLQHYQQPFANNPNWFSTVDVATPNYLLFEIGYSNKDLDGKTATILGIYPTDDGYWGIKTAISRNDADKNTVFSAIVTVYAKKIQGKYKLFSQLQRYLSFCELKVIGNLSFYTKKGQKFKENDAKRLDSLNKSLAKQFNLPEFSCNIVAVNNVVELYSEVLGYDYAPQMFVAVQKGGLADRVNNTLLSANGSPFYAHELVHFYTQQFAAEGKYVNSFFDEGAATFFGGSREQPLDWHIKKLKIYLAEHPEMDLEDLNNIGYKNTKTWDLPDATYSTDIRYTLGGALCRLQYKQKGVEGLRQLLNAPSNDIYTNIEAFFGVKKENFRAFFMNL